MDRDVRTIDLRYDRRWPRGRPREYRDGRGRAHLISTDSPPGIMGLKTRASSAACGAAALPELAMPLLDHFHPPLSRTHPWPSFHGSWAAAMARLLNAGILPPGYYAAPFFHRDGPVEIDVATFRESEAADGEGCVQT